jgi:Tfp pilus assembly protein PilX
MSPRLPGRQRGMTLMVALIMLVLMTMFMVTNFKMGNSSLQIVGNMQARTQAMNAAQSTIEEAISTTQFTTSPAAALRNPCAATANTRCYGLNGNTTTGTDITVTLTPAPVCISSQAIPNSSLNLTNDNDAGCVTGVTQSFGIANSVTGASLCADTTWQVSAVAVDSVTKSSASVVQGVTVRVTSDSLATTCPP